MDEDDGVTIPPEGNIESGEPEDGNDGGGKVCKGAEESVSVPVAGAEAALVGAPVPVPVPVPPALLESWANPMEGGVARNTE